MPQTLAKPSLLMRVIYNLPFVGRIARDIAKDQDSIFYALVILATLVVLAVKAWGIVALAMSALALVPVMFAVLIMISRG